MKSIYTIKEYAKAFRIHPSSAEQIIKAIVFVNGGKKMIKAKESEEDRFELYDVHSLEPGDFKPHDPFGLHRRKVEPLNLDWRKGAQIT